MARKTDTRKTGKPNRAGDQAGVPGRPNRAGDQAAVRTPDSASSQTSLECAHDARQDTAPPPASGKRSLILLILAFAGPGIIAELAGNDAGGISTFSVAGAQYGTSVLWAVPVAMLFLMVVQEGAARLGARTGKGFAALIRENFGIRLAALAMLALLVANSGTTLSEFAGIAAGMELFGVSKYVSVPVAALAIWTLLMIGSYRRTERIFLAISLVFLTYVVAAFLSKPNWGDVAWHTLVPTLVPQPGFAALIIAIIGTTVAPWMIFFGQSNVVEKGVTQKDLFFLRIDVFSGAVAACLVVWFIMITTGTVLYGAGIQVHDSADAALALQPALGAGARYLFGLGLVGASFLAACVLPITTSYAICEAFGWEHGPGHRWSEAPAYKGIITAVIVFSAAVVLIPGVDLMAIMLMAQVVNGVLLPVLLVFLLLLANNKRLMGRFTNGRMANLLSLAVIVAIVLLTLGLLVMQALGWE
ncbi:MAG: divalent metal cation transporter [Coriobacteriales bacterium]|jgi:NRAMP (natural resistance-associated macrophage protein)-like metal ion transporter|nr:divalent metal cation transporter [Coriobacteriales bacterium]